MKKILLIIIVTLCSSICYAEVKKALYDSVTGEIKATGYSDFKTLTDKDSNLRVAAVPQAMESTTIERLKISNDRVIEKTADEISAALDNKKRELLSENLVFLKSELESLKALEKDEGIDYASEKAKLESQIDQIKNDLGSTP